jgi:hypothetical protein
MRFMTNVAVDGVQAMIPAPVFRAFGGFAAACRPVSGQECSGSAAIAWRVESVSGAVVTGAAGRLGLVASGDGLLARHGYAAQLGQERPRPVFRPVGSQDRIQGDEQAWTHGSGISENTDGSSNKRDNGSKPMSPRDFRTSSPPG